MMKKNYFIIVAAIIFSCNSDQPSSSTQSSQSSAKKLLPELSTGTKSDFKKVDSLPAGIENIFGKKIISKRVDTGSGFLAEAINLSGFAAGTYILKIGNKTAKFIKLWKTSDNST